jgi:hypothetical protein
MPPELRIAGLHNNGSCGSERLGAVGTRSAGDNLI